MSTINQCYVQCQPQQQQPGVVGMLNELNGSNQHHLQSTSVMMTSVANQSHQQLTQSRAANIITKDHVQQQHDQALRLHHQRERLNHLIGLIGNQNLRLQSLKLLRGLVQQQASVNNQLECDLHHLRDEISAKEHQLQEAKSKLDALERRLSQTNHRTSFNTTESNLMKNLINGNLDIANNNNNNLSSDISKPRALIAPTTNGTNAESNLSSESDDSDSSLALQTSLIQLDGDLNDNDEDKNSHDNSRSSPIQLDEVDRFQCQSPKKPLLPFNACGHYLHHSPVDGAKIRPQSNSSSVANKSGRESGTRDLNRLDNNISSKKQDSDDGDASTDDGISSGQNTDIDRRLNPNDTDARTVLFNNESEKQQGQTNHIANDDEEAATTTTASTPTTIVRRVSFDPLALLLDAALEGELELVKRTSREVADISASNDEGLTALHNAVVANHFEIVKYLVEQGCDVNGQDGDGWTPLHCAASCNNLKLCQFLVEHGASIFATTQVDDDTAASKCKEEDNGYRECYNYLAYIQEHIGKINNGIVYALFDYEAQRSDELSFVIGDQLIVSTNDDHQEQEWWWARHRGNNQLPSHDSNGPSRQGFIPRNLFGLYPRVVKPTNANSIIRASAKTTPSKSKSPSKCLSDI